MSTDNPPVRFIKDDLHNLLEQSAKALLDSVDIMNDGPDDSDVAMAQGRLQTAYEKAREWRDLYRSACKREP